MFEKKMLVLQLQTALRQPSHTLFKLDAKY